MTVEEFVAEMRAHAREHRVSADWLGEQQGRALALGLDWQEVAAVLIEQQRAAVQQSLETP